ncbi:hypothetical protein ACHZ97_17760 [Lysobacter soli]|uniref:hypothetical protein n=1 Tax=Lysobacter soli TaxID=453783 RepID=UPI0037CBC9EC
MTEAAVLVVITSALAMPFLLYLFAKFSPAATSVAYDLLGALCLIVALAFFAFVGWYFLETGQLVSPGKGSIPSEVIASTAPLAHRVVVGAVNVSVGSLLAFIGVSLLRIGQRRRSTPGR